MLFAVGGTRTSMEGQVWTVHYLVVVMVFEISYSTE